MVKAEKSINDVEYDQVLECQFGSIKYDKNDVISFPDGLFGYEQYNQYLFWENNEYLPFRWLICIENPGLMFPVIDPNVVLPDYNPKIDYNGNLSSILTIVTIGDSMESVTINLRAPVVIFQKQRAGKQIILTDTDYPLRYKVLKN